jgi:hypothetical protein
LSFGQSFKEKQVGFNNRIALCILNNSFLPTERNRLVERVSYTMIEVIFKIFLTDYIDFQGFITKRIQKPLLIEYTLQAA